MKAVGLAVDPEQGRFAVFVPGVRGGAPGVKGFDFFFSPLFC